MVPAGLSQRSARTAVLATTGAGALIVLTAAFVWSERKPIGQRFVDDYLRSRGVAGRFTITRLDAAGVSGSLIVGRPGDPDLSVARVDVTIAPLSLTAHGFAPRVVRVRLQHPVLKASFDGRRLSFGGLQPLLEGNATTSGASPAITIENGRLIVGTPGGRLLLDGEGAIGPGTSVQASLRVAGGAFGVPALAVEAPSGTLQLTTPEPARAHFVWTLSATSAASEVAHASGLQFQGDADWPMSGRGATRTVALLRARTVADAQVSGRDLTARLQASGMIARTATATAFAGDASAQAVAVRSVSGGAAVTQTAVALETRHARWALETPTAGAVRLRSVDAPFHLALDVGSLDLGATTPLRMSAAMLRGHGRASFGGQGPSLVFSGAAHAHGALAASATRRVADVVPTLLGPKLRSAVAHALASFSADAGRFDLSADATRAALAFPQPLRVRGDGDVVMTLGGASTPSVLRVSRGVSTGGFAVALAGPDLPSVRATVARYLVGRPREGTPVDADVVVTADGDLGALRGMTVRARTTLWGRKGRLRVVAQDCARIGFADFDLAATDPTTSGSTVKAPAASLRDARLRLCPTTTPLLSIERDGWRAAGLVASLDARLAGPKVAIAVASLQFDARGAAVPTAAEMRLEGVELRDVAAPARFHRLSVAGSASLDGHGWRGAADLRLAPDQPVSARLRFTHDPRDARGEASLESLGLRFTPTALQPAQLLVAAAPWVSQVDGAVDLAATAAWTGSTLTTGARVRTEGLALRTPAGPLLGLRGDLRFTSLMPLMTAPDQRITADALTALLPLTRLSVDFDLDARRLVLRDATAILAGGRVRLDPMSLPITPTNAASAPTASGAVRLDGVDAATLVAAVNLSNAVALQAKLQGVLPFALGPAGLRLTQGRLAAAGPGRLTLRRQTLTGAMATAGAAGAQPGAVQDFAYQALENLAFDTLDAAVASRPGGRLGVVLHVIGRHDPAVAVQTRVRLDDLLRGHAFDKPLPLPKGTPIDLTLDTSLNFDELLGDYGGLRLTSTQAAQPVAP